MDVRVGIGGVGGEFADDLFQQIGVRDQALKVAVLVDHHRHAPLDALEVDQLLIQAGALGDEVGRAGDVAQVFLDLAAVHQNTERIAGMEDADQVVEAAVEQRQPRVIAALDGGDDLLFGVLQIDASTSLRGIMMSSTVAFSRSRMASSMSRLRSGIMAPASLTTVRSSSWLRACPAAHQDARRAAEQAIGDDIDDQTTGCSSFSSGV
jgi:hypothetical protein